MKLELISFFCSYPRIYESDLPTRREIIRRQSLCDYSKMRTSAAKAALNLQAYVVAKATTHNDS
jgi:hypothetical protein